MGWLKARIVEGSTWAAISHWLLIGGLLTFTSFPHWRVFVWAALVTAIVAAVLPDRRA